jgi:ferritin-like metal-binding protein YciE
MNNLEDLFLDELADIYHAEKQLLKALPKVAAATENAELREAIEAHLEETREQVNRLEQVFEIFGRPAKGKRCEAMEGLVEEANNVISEEDASSTTDAALIAGSQKIEHYEIASYGCLCTWAELLGKEDALELLKLSIAEEKAADEKLTAIAEGTINAESNNEESEAEETEPKRMASASSRRSSSGGAARGGNSNPRGSAQPQPRSKRRSQTA